MGAISKGNARTIMTQNSTNQASCVNLGAIRRFSLECEAARKLQARGGFLFSGKVVVKGTIKNNSVVPTLEPHEYLGANTGGPRIIGANTVRPPPGYKDQI